MVWQLSLPTPVELSYLVKMVWQIISTNTCGYSLPCQYGVQIISTNICGALLLCEYGVANYLYQHLWSSLTLSIWCGKLSLPTPVELSYLFNMAWQFISTNTCGALLPCQYGVANYLYQHLWSSLTLSIWCGKLSLPTPVELSYLVNMVWQIISTNTCGTLLPCQYGVANYLYQHLWSSLSLSIWCGKLSLPTPVELSYLVNMAWQFISSNTCGALLPCQYGVANYLYQHLWSSLTLSIWCGKLSLPTPVEFSYLVNMVWQIISYNTCGALLPCQYGMAIYLYQHLWSSLTLSIWCGKLSLPTPVELSYLVNMVWQIISTNTCGALLPCQYGVANYLYQHLWNSLTLSIWCGKLSPPTPVELSFLVNMVWQIISTNTCGAFLPCQYSVANYLFQHLWSSLTLSIWCGKLSLPTPVELSYLVNMAWQFISSNTCGAPSPCQYGVANYLCKPGKIELFFLVMTPFEIIFCLFIWIYYT